MIKFAGDAEVKKSTVEKTEIETNALHIGKIPIGPGSQILTLILDTSKTSLDDTK